MIESVDAERVVVRADKPSKDPRDAGVDIYNLIKYQRSNQNTCINQQPVVVHGERVNTGDVLADGPSTDVGELALGRNVLVAFMPWGGYNFEDSILISERVVKDDLFTSVHIEEFECVARDTKLGPEEITRDIPNVGEEALRDLDTSGIIRIGAEVRPGDILVGKITPKGETQLSPEEKLLRAIFGEKAGEVRDTSLRVPPGVEGAVIGARVFARRGVTRDDRSQEIHGLEIERLKQDESEEIRIIRQETLRKLKRALVGKKLAGRGSSRTTAACCWPRATRSPTRRSTSCSRPSGSSCGWRTKRATADAAAAVAAMRSSVDAVAAFYGAKQERLRGGDELAPGVIKMIKVFVAIKRRLQVGDKMAGRHGNKGVLSRILPEEDMPRTEDGTPVDMVLNPLGVPSRMNVGQILETHLGWAAREIGHKFDAELKAGATPAQMRKRLREFYNDHESQEFVEQLPDAEVMKLAAKCRDGRARRLAGIRRRARRGNLRRCSSAPSFPKPASARSTTGAPGIKLRAAGHSRRDVHDEAASPGRGQDPRALDRTLQPGHPAAAGRQGAVRRPAARRDGSVGAGSLRRGLHAAGDADGEVRRRGRAHAHVRGNRQGREHAGAGPAGVVQRDGQGAAIALPQRRAARAAVAAPSAAVKE